jgi:TRAP-type C4-dicarboxylate transport system permease large subunit
VEEKFDVRRVWAALKEASWALILPALILGGIFGGIVTATEGAALAVLAAIVIGALIYRELNLKDLYVAMVDGVVQTAVVMLLVAASALLGVHLTEIQAPQQLAAAASSLSNEMWDVTRVNVWFIAVLLVVLLLSTYVPLFPLGLVHLFYGG